MAFLERGAVDQIEIYVLPEMLGAGRPLFPSTGFRASPRLVEAGVLGGKCVRLQYQFDNHK